MLPREGTVVKATWTNVAFTFKGLKALGVPQEELSFPEEFSKGMAARAAVIGDVDKSAPANWIPPLRVKTPSSLYWRTLSRVKSVISLE